MLINPTKQQEKSIVPLGSQQQLRFDSEVIKTALANCSFLQQTNNLYPLILSTRDGVLLGNTTDPTGEFHSDYLFLCTRLYNLGHSPHSITPDSAFVCLFPQLGHAPQPWLLPYLNPKMDVSHPCSFSEKELQD